MTNCAKIDVRERLPELVHGQLSPAEAATVTSHIAECAACASELELLRLVMASAAPAPAISVEKIVAALPSPTPAAPAKRPILSPKRRLIPLSARTVQIAAGFALAASVLFVIMRREVEAPEVRPAPALQTAAKTNEPAIPSSSVPTLPAATAQSRETRVVSGPGLTLGGSTEDLSDESLAILVDEMDRLDGVPTVEPESLDPSLGDEGGR